MGLLLVRSGSFVLLWIVLLPIYRSLHPLKITALNGPNAIKGTTTCQHTPAFARRKRQHNCTRA